MITRKEFLVISSASALAAIGFLSGCSPDPRKTEQGSAASNTSAPAPDGKQEPKTSTASKTAVVCFSATGNTWGIARKLADAKEADLIRVEAEDPYTEDDLNYDKNCRANAEQDEGSARPGIAGGAPDLRVYDVIFLGYPIWWGRAPRIVLTLLESVDLAGKRVAPFCTSGESGIAGSLSELKAAAPSATWLDGKRFEAGASSSEIAQWVGKTE